MCNVTPIIAETESPDNTLPQCPAGCGPAQFSSRAQTVTCPACGLTLDLTEAETDDLTDALIGLNPDLRLDLFLAEIARRAALEAAAA